MFMGACVHVHAAAAAGRARWLDGRSELKCRRRTFPIRPFPRSRSASAVAGPFFITKAPPASATTQSTQKGMMAKSRRVYGLGSARGQHPRFLLVHAQQQLMRK